MTSIQRSARVGNSVPSRPATGLPNHRPQFTHQPLDGPLFNAQFRRQVAHLHALGVRPTAELLLEHVGNDEQARNTLLLLLERYGRLDPAVVKAIGADTFPPVIFPVGSR